MRLFAENNALHILAACNPGNNGGLTPELRAYLMGKLLWNPYMSLEEYEDHINDFLSHFYGKGWEEIRHVNNILYETTKERCISCFEIVEEDCWRNEDYIPVPYQRSKENHYLTGFIAHMDEIKACYDRAFALAETEEERRHPEISRIAVTYVDLFLTPHCKEEMTEEEQKAYEAEVEQLYRDKERLGCRCNTWTSNAQQR